MPFSTPEEDFYMTILLSQLLSDSSSNSHLKMVLDSKDLNFIRSLPFRPEHPFRSSYFN